MPSQVDTNMSPASGLTNVPQDPRANAANMPNTYTTEHAKFSSEVDTGPFVEFTALDMQGTLPDCCAWILHTSVTWLSKDTQQGAADAEEASWIRLWREANAQTQYGEGVEALVSQRTHPPQP